MECLHRKSVLLPLPQSGSRPFHLLRLQTGRVDLLATAWLMMFVGRTVMPQSGTKIGHLQETLYNCLFSPFPEYTLTIEQKTQVCKETFCWVHVSIWTQTSVYTQTETLESASMKDLKRLPGFGENINLPRNTL